jgi:hypothetical protein
VSPRVSTADRFALSSRLDVYISRQELDDPFPPLKFGFVGSHAMSPATAITGSEDTAARVPAREAEAGELTENSPSEVRTKSPAIMDLGNLLGLAPDLPPARWPSVRGRAHVIPRNKAPAPSRNTKAFPDLPQGYHFSNDAKVTSGSFLTTAQSHGSGKIRKPNINGKVVRWRPVTATARMPTSAGRSPARSALADDMLLTSVSLWIASDNLQGSASLGGTRALGSAFCPAPIRGSWGRQGRGRRAGVPPTAGLLTIRLPLGGDRCSAPASAEAAVTGCAEPHSTAPAVRRADESVP